MPSPVQVPEHLMTAAAVPSLERQQVLAGLGSSGRGLSADEAAARRAEIGANQLPAPRRRPVLAEFGAQFANMFAVVLMVAAGITFVAYALTAPRSSANLVLAIGIWGRPAAGRTPSRPRPEGATFGPARADQRPCRCGRPRTMLGA
jgi:hypothetical protein